ncbi:MAG: trehalase family glycosidase, partial [Vicinamibacterales bacterium]
TGHPVDDPFVPTSTPYLAVPLDGSVGISTGRARSVDEIRGLLDARLREADVRGASFGPLSSAAFAIEAALAWNTIYEPRHDRVVTTVGRLWNEEYGGYALFGWDNFFLAYALTLFDRDLAFATVVEHLAGRTPDGFIPNDNAGNGRTSLDRSQPPVGALMVREIYRRFPERWFLEATFDDLLAWNRWWPHARANGALLAYGSSKAPNPFNEPDRETMVTARYESGMDDSPMYEDVPFSAETHTMALQDVGLTSLYVVDCEALADMARVLGREAIARELEGRADDYRRALDTLWHEPTGLYLNRRTDTGDWSFRLSPTHFYPLLAGVPSPERAARMIERHLLNRDEFWGEHLLPSIARSDPEFPRQRYWRGAIWPPLNFLTYAGVRRAGHAASQRALADASISLFMREWQRHGYVSENYSAVTGTGDDERLSSDRFHSWGVLFALPAFIEAGFISAPADAGSVAAHP